jgi:nucleotide-binding universal stress UspA family protein
MKTIIVATNYSNEANNAVNYAAELASHLNSKLVLFNSFELSVHASNALLPGSSIGRLITENNNLLRNIALDLSGKYGITVDHIRTSDLMEELDFQVKRLNADLVVMGMKDVHSGFVPFSSISTAIHHANYPILTVPEGASFNNISKILFAFNPDCIEEVNKLPVLMEFAKHFNAEIQVCHVQKSRQPTINQVSAKGFSFNTKAILGDAEHSYKEINDNNVLKGIENLIENWQADLLVMVPHKYGFWESIWHKSKTIQMAKRTRIPLLTLPNPEASNRDEPIKYLLMN